MNQFIHSGLRSVGLGKSAISSVQSIGRYPLRRAIACAAAIVVALVVPATGGVTYTTKYQSYKVGGTTEKGIVSYMRANPYRGDSGHAYANIKHRFSINVDTEQVGKQCRVDQLDLRMSFVITTPVSANPSALSRSARQSFAEFAAFTKRHEEEHRASFINCGKAYAAKAARQTAGQCRALVSELKQMLRQMDKDCQVKQAALDRRDSKRVHGLTLFRKGR